MLCLVSALAMWCFVRSHGLPPVPVVLLFLTPISQWRGPISDCPRTSSHHHPDPHARSRYYRQPSGVSFFGLVHVCTAACVHAVSKVLGAVLPVPEAPLPPKEEADARTHTTAIVQWTVPVYVAIAFIIGGSSGFLKLIRSCKGRCKRIIATFTLTHTHMPHAHTHHTRTTLTPNPPNPHPGPGLVVFTFPCSGTSGTQSTATKLATPTWAQACGFRCVGRGWWGS
jgi:hypothetical protein